MDMTETGEVLLDDLPVSEPCHHVMDMTETGTVIPDDLSVSELCDQIMDMAQAPPPSSSQRAIADHPPSLPCPLRFSLAPWPWCYLNAFGVFFLMIYIVYICTLLTCMLQHP